MLRSEMTIRQQQVARQLLAEISDIIRNEMHDPRLGFLTLVAAEPTRDLRAAHVHVSVLGDADEGAECIRVLSGAAGYIRGLLGRRLTLRFTPELSFHLDASAETAQRVEAALAELEFEDSESAAEDETIDEPEQPS